MNANIIQSLEDKVNSPDSVYFIVGPDTDLSQLLDGVYPYDGNGSGDQWVVVIECHQVAWARDWSVAAMQEIEALRVRREHSERCPDEVPFDGMVFASGIEWDGESVEDEARRIAQELDEAEIAWREVTAAARYGLTEATL